MSTLRKHSKQQLQVLKINARKLAIVDAVIDLVEAQMDVPRRAMMGRCRVAHISWARHCAMALARELTALSLEKLAPLFNRENFGTIGHAMRHVKSACQMDKRKSAEFETLRKLALEICGE